MLKVEKIDSASASLFDTRRQHIIIFAVCFVLLLTRRPDAILNAQFWAEDGKDWYANAYNLGAVKSLFMAHDGYFQTISRITASIAQAFPLIWAPLIFNSVALIFEILPVNLILSSRFSEVIPNKSARLLLAFLYIALPNSVEVHANFAALLLMPVGIIRDWKYPPMPDLEFKSYAEKLREAPQGNVVTIPINPAGWSAKLIKH